MTTPREPREPRGPHDPYEPDDPTWGRPPAEGWGSEPDRGGYDPGGYDPGRYDPGQYDPRGRGGYAAGPGPYGSEPEYGWQQPEYEPAGSYGAAPPPGADTYRPEPGRREPAWAPVSPGTPPTARRSARRRRRPPWIPVAVAAAVVVAVLVLGFVTPGWFVTRVFDPAAVQTGVAKILTDDYGAEGVADVRCPGGVGVTAGATFTCDATIDGDPVKIPVRVTDGSGRYEVGRPT
jgi:Domain of unknown function (DUF4333)